GLGGGEELFRIRRLLLAEPRAKVEGRRQTALRLERAFAALESAVPGGGCAAYRHSDSPSEVVRGMVASPGPPERSLAAVRRIRFIPPGPPRRRRTRRSTRGSPSRAPRRWPPFGPAAAISSCSAPAARWDRRSPPCSPAPRGTRTADA